MPVKLFSGPLARKFASLAFLIVLPLWAISTYLLVMSLDELQSYSQQEVSRLAELSGNSVELWYRDQVGDIQMLTRLPQFEHGATREAYDLITEVAAMRPEWHGFSLIDAQGNLLLYSIRPYGEPLPNLMDVAALRTAIAEKRPTVSGVYITRVDRIPGVALEVPILREGKVIGVLGTVYRAADLGHLFLGGDLPQATDVKAFGRSGGVVTVFDQSGRVVYRSLEPERWMAKDESAFLARVAPPGKERAVVQTKGLDGVERVYAYRLVPSMGWRVLVGMPVSQTQGVRWRLLPPALLLDVVAMLLTLGLVIVMARRFTQPALELRDAAIAFGEGHLDARVTRPPRDEIGDVGHAFNRMAEQIRAAQETLEGQVAERTRQLASANQELAESNAQMILSNGQLSATVEELKRLEEQRAEFLNMTSHDLRIPLTAIRGYAEFLEDGTGGPLTPLQREFVSQMMSSIERMTELLEELLDFARVEAGQLKLDLQTVDLSELVPAVVSPLVVLADRKQQRLELDVPDGLPLVTADPSRLQQVLTNFLSNAIKYTPEGGRIVLQARAQGDTIRVAVADTGIGISAEDQKELFKRFFRAQNVDGIPGTGLGLSISRGIIEAHGGRVGAESTLGEGSTFWFELPIRREG